MLTNTPLIGNKGTYIYDQLFPLYFAMKKADARKFNKFEDKTCAIQNLMLKKHKFWISCSFVLPANRTKIIL
jgi:hypothetical protein